jgi:multiple sugar transport system ATP-binding protein
MAGVRLHGVTKQYHGGEVAVDNIDLEILDREFMVLVGPSGCGKTTTLRMIAGLEQVTDGEILIGERRVNEIPPRDRDIAMVFQDYALYANMTVFDNLAFGLRMRKTSKAEVRERVDRIAQLLGIQELLGRRPRQLSGGQRQRVALGRAIIRRPVLFLMDEPLSNLDALLRTHMRTELLKLHDLLQTTVVYVTHDQTEAMTMGSRIAVMRDGRVQQVGTPAEIYDGPVNSFVAGFFGSPPMNFVRGVVTEDDRGPVFRAGTLEVPLPPLSSQRWRAGFPEMGRDVMLGVRPESITFASEGSDDVVTFSAEVEVTEPLGHETIIYVNPGGATLAMRVQGRTGLDRHTTVGIGVYSHSIHIFDAHTELALTAPTEAPEWPS